MTYRDIHICEHMNQIFQQLTKHNYIHQHCQEIFNIEMIGYLEKLVSGIKTFLFHFQNYETLKKNAINKR